MTIDSRNDLFSACLHFRSIRNGQPSDSDVWEESIIIVHADCEKSALDRATDCGRQRVVYYTTQSGDRVVVDFVSVERVFKIDDSLAIDGAEVFSRHLRGSEIKSLGEPFPEA
jgi:hypothetical protein